MQPLPPRDVSAIGTAVGRAVEAHALVRRADGKPHLPAYYFAQAVARLRDELAQAGFEIVRVMG